MDKPVADALPPTEGNGLFLQRPESSGHTLLPLQCLEGGKPTGLGWDTPGRALTAQPVKVVLKDPTRTRHKKKNPQTQGQSWLTSTYWKVSQTWRFKALSTSLEHPSFTSKKAKWDYRMVQALRAVNAAVTLVRAAGRVQTLLLPRPRWRRLGYGTSLRTRLVLHPTKGGDAAAVCLCVDLTFKAAGCSMNLDGLATGIQNGPHLLGAALGKDPRAIPSSEGTEIQHADGTLTCGPTQETADKDSLTSLNFLAKRGYRASPKKAQISLQKVRYLGDELTPGHPVLPLTEKGLCRILSLRLRKNHPRFSRHGRFRRVGTAGLDSAKPLHDRLPAPVRALALD